MIYVEHMDTLQEKSIITSQDEIRKESNVHVEFLIIWYSEKMTKKENRRSNSQKHIDSCCLRSIAQVRRAAFTITSTTCCYCGEDYRARYTTDAVPATTNLPRLNKTVCKKYCQLEYTTYAARVICRYTVRAQSCIGITGRANVTTDASSKRHQSYEKQ
jgi:hypothetical protein